MVRKMRQRVVWAWFALATMILVSGLGVSPAQALVREQMTQSFDHFSPAGTYESSFEHKIDIPADWATNNLVFAARVVRLTGKLMVEREELTATYYYIKVGLPRALAKSASGTVTIDLEASTQGPILPVMDACAELTLGGTAGKPAFSWQGNGYYTAISLFDRSWNKTVWERVVLNATAAVKVDGNMMVGHHYIWAVKQTDATARYSTESQAAFAIGTRPDPCSKCYGEGKIMCPQCRGSGTIMVPGPNHAPIPKMCLRCNGTGYERCTACNGHGTIATPILVEEPVPGPGHRGQ